MSFVAALEVDKLNLRILECKFGVDTNIDASGWLVSKPVAGIIRVTVESTKSTVLFDWSVTPAQVKNGSITFFTRESPDSRMRRLEFKDAICIGYHETFVADGEEPMKIELTISARELKMEQVVHKNEWPGFTA